MVTTGPRGCFSEEDKSVTRQVENAKAFAAKMGWTVADAHIYIDDGKSGAEFAARPDFMRMMGTLPTSTVQSAHRQRAEVHRPRNVRDGLRD